MLKSEIKESAILLVFAALLNETLTIPTIVFVAISAVMVWFLKKPGKVLRNVFTLGIFISYWVTYGKVIDPEIGLNFLTTIIALKLLEKESKRDSYMILFGLILLISAGSLFLKSLSYVFFFGLSFLILIQDFYKTQNLSTKISDLSKSLFWVLPFSGLLFFLSPRIMSPFHLDQGGTKEGEVGYTPEVMISQMEGLSANDRPVFEAIVDRQLNSEELYWRGNTLTFSDGWNWPLMPQDRHRTEFDPFKIVPQKGIKQKIRVFSRQDYFFGLDHPDHILTPRGVATLGDSHSQTQNTWQRFARYEVISFQNAFESSAPLISNFGLKMDEKDWINKTFTSQNLEELKIEIQEYFRLHGFSYSLTPGRVENILDFMQNKKIGFCSHYASAVGLILRTKNIPTRLVSGFLGGNYNRFAGLYLITQNDAHVWVEAFSQGKWQRLDPTGWIAPERVRLGGSAFMSQKKTTGYKWLLDAQQWMGQWDSRFYQWLEDMDYYGQESFFEKLNLKRNWIFTLIPILITFFIGLFAWQLSRGKPQASELEKLWKFFQLKLKKRGLDLSLYSIEESRSILKNAPEEVISVWEDLVAATFKQNKQTNILDIKRKIKRL